HPGQLRRRLPLRGAEGAVPGADQQGGFLRAERLRAVRRARQRLGVVPGLVRFGVLREESAARPAGAGRGVVASAPRRQLGLLRPALPVGLAQRPGADEAARIPRLPRRAGFAGMSQEGIVAGLQFTCGGWVALAAVLLPLTPSRGEEKPSWPPPLK